MSIPDTFVLTGGLAMSSYLWFKKYESTSPLALGVSLGILPSLPLIVFGSPVQSALLGKLTVYGFYYCLLLLYVAVYRLSYFHPLREYPGPLLARLSKLYLLYVSVRGKQQEDFKKLHDIYGPIVRVGPNELSIVDEKLLPSIMGASGMPKGPLWDGRRPNRNPDPIFLKADLIGARDRRLHADARKAWNRAFTSASVKSYEPILMRRTTELIEQLKLRCTAGASETGKKADQIDLSLWLNYFSLDFIGDFVLSRPFDLMRNGDPHGLLRLTEEGTFAASVTQNVPWLLDVLSWYPALFQLAFGKLVGIGQFAFKQAMKRIKEEPTQTDLMYYLNEKDEDDPEPPSPYLVQWSALIAIVAGSDGPATAMSSAMLCLVRHPEWCARIRADIDREFPLSQAEPPSPSKLAKMDNLNAFINEVLRLYPPIATGLQRAPTPGSGGHMLGSSMFIPEGTAVYAAPYVYQRDPRYFSPDPDRFWPERWLLSAGDGLILNTNAYLPFSLGPANCVGKPLALVQLRLVIASLVQAFDIEFAKGYDDARWERELKDYFISHRGKLLVVLTPRHASN